jgi:hypothetical protein
MNVNWGLSRGRPTKGEGVGDDGDGAEAHGSAGDHGTKEDAQERIERPRGDGDAEDVVDKAEEEVLADVALAYI